MTNAIKAHSVSKRFGDIQAVNNIDFAIPQGSLCGFLGPNGAGKSTTIRMIMSIIYPDEGSISALGGSALDHKDAIGYLPEERGLYRKMRVGTFLHYIARLKGIDRHGLSKRIDDWLERLALPGVQKRKCQELSKGMQQKVQFIAAVINEPELIILDEPFSGLDPVNARLLGDTIRQLNDGGRTIIFSTHVLHQAELLCDRVLLINSGRIVLDDAVASIRERFNPRTVLIEPTAPLDNAAAKARRLPGVASIETSTEKNRLELHLSTPTTAHEGLPEELMNGLPQLGPIRSIELRRVTLDDVFLTLVGSSIAAIEDTSQ